MIELEMYFKLIDTFMESDKTTVWGETYHDEKATENMKVIADGVTDIMDKVYREYWNTYQDGRISYDNQNTVLTKLIKDMTSTVIDIIFETDSNDGTFEQLIADMKYGITEREKEKVNGKD